MVCSAYSIVPPFNEIISSLHSKLNMTTKVPENDHLHVWVSPPNKKIPLVNSPIRFAVGTPDGMSSNSWRVWVRGEDVYVSCRDNFKELKVSLHASGVWRVAFTEQAFSSNPDLFSANGDRLLQRYKPDLTQKNKAVVGFQIVILNTGLYLKKDQRKKWPNSIVFIEPPSSDRDMSVLSIVVVSSTEYISVPENVRGVVIGKLHLGSDKTVQLVVTHESNEIMRPQIAEAFERSLPSHPSNLTEDAIFTVHGSRGDGTPWISALKVSDLKSGVDNVKVD